MISEDRQVNREKYSQAKLLANFVQASSAYLTSTPGNLSNSSYTTTTALSVTPLFGNASFETEPLTNFYVVRHANYSSLANTPYKLTVTSSGGNLSIPQLGGELSLQGRDANIHTTDYKVGDINIMYCSADIFTS